MRYTVLGNHPTLRYITKFNLSEKEKDELIKELEIYDYEIEVNEFHSKNEEIPSLALTNIGNRYLEALEKNIDDFKLDYLNGTCTSTYSNEKQEKPLTLETIHDMIQKLEEHDYWNKIAKEHGYNLNHGDKMLVSRSFAEGKPLRQGVEISNFVPHDEIIFIKAKVFEDHLKFQW